MKGSVAMCLRCGGTFDDCFITCLLLSPMVKELKIGQHLAGLPATGCPVFDSGVDRTVQYIIVF